MRKVFREGDLISVSGILEHWCCIGGHVRIVRCASGAVLQAGSELPFPISQVWNYSYHVILSTGWEASTTACVASVVFHLAESLHMLLLSLQAEVQGKNQDGGIQLHTRSSKFGKVCIRPWDLATVILVDGMPHECRAAAAAGVSLCGRSRQAQLLCAQLLVTPMNRTVQALPDQESADCNRKGGGNQVI